MSKKPKYAEIVVKIAVAVASIMLTRFGVPLLLLLLLLLLLSSLLPLVCLLAFWVARSVAWLLVFVFDLMTCVLLSFFFCDCR